MNVLINKKLETQETVTTEILFLIDTNAIISSSELKKIMDKEIVNNIVLSFNEICNSLKMYDHTIQLTKGDNDGDIIFEFTYSVINKEEVFRKLSSKIKGMCKSIFNARVSYESISYEIYPKWEDTQFAYLLFLIHTD